MFQISCYIFQCVFVSLMCSLYLLILYMWYFSTVFYLNAFLFLCFYDVHCISYGPTCGLCLTTPNCCYLSQLCVHNPFRKFVDWASRGACEGGGTAHTSFPHSLLFNWHSVEARPLWRQVVSECVSHCLRPFSTTVEMGINQQLEQRINIKFLLKLGKAVPKFVRCCSRLMGKMP
jgi:hypothetical protein